VLTTRRHAAATILLAALPRRGSAAGIDIDAAADGGTIDLAVGSTLRLSLLENPSTGFRWRVAADGAPALRVEAEDYLPSGAMPGAPGLHRWEFRAIQPGEARLRLDHARAWETVPPVETFALTIRVTG